MPNLKAAGHEPISIESLGTPLVFKVGGEAAPGDALAGLRLRSRVRALQGMQKEALVHHGPSRTVWRMVSDEGPYLAGTDLAPFPLGFYTAGVVLSFMNEVLRHAARLGVGIDSLELTSDHYYTMHGSALRGDMVGGAAPIELRSRIVSAASEPTLLQILDLALASSPAEAYMRESLENRFSLTANRRPVEVEDLRPSPGRAEDPVASFDGVQPVADGYLEEIIKKIASVEVKHGVEGGEGSSLKAEQKRTLHVRGEARLLSDTLREVQVHLFRPLGSSFRFLSEEAGSESAPPALAYLAAGVGFCYMTQVGRYAHITRNNLRSYRIVQDNAFHPGGATTKLPETVAEPVDTHVFLDLDEPDDVARKIAYMGERTCFLHAAMRGTHPTRVCLA